MAMVKDRGMLYAELLRLRQEYKEYRDSHWDNERNHIRIEYANGLYEIFRQGIIVRRALDDLTREQVAKMQPQPRIIETQLNFL